MTRNGRRSRDGRPLRDPHPFRDPRIAAWNENWADAPGGRAPDGRTPDDEAQLLEAVRAAIVDLQASAAKGGRAGRALHAKGIIDTRRARLSIGDGIPEALQLGPFRPGADWPVHVRLSSASPVRQSDMVPDQRGLAVRILDGDRRLDLLTTTGEAHHARDAAALIASLRAASTAARGGTAAKIRGLAGLVADLGPRDALRMVRTVSRARVRGTSLAALDFYSRAPFQLGRFAVRYRFAARRGVDPGLRGHDGDALHDEGARQNGDALHDDLQARLEVGSVEWSFELQGFLDPERTPLDDHRVVWECPWIAVGTLRLSSGADNPGSPGEASSSSSAETSGSSSPEPGFRAEPDWPDPTGHVLRPLGELNRLRGIAYAASRAGRAAPGDR